MVCANRRILSLLAVTVLMVALTAVLVQARPLNDPVTRGGVHQPPPNAALTPAPSTWDQIIHDQGNIVTTVDNWGYIGGYQYYGYPSGEYPAFSGHDYIGAIYYWFGGVTAGGDTLVANTSDDFQALPSLISGQDQTSIMLSTDESRYYDYDPSDTVGSGFGNPANGWRVWDIDSSDWEYKQVYDPIDSVFYEGGPIAVQESYYRFDDAALGTSLMGLEMTHSMLQWNYCYNEDILFCIIEIHNGSAEDIEDFAVGLYIDIDVGGPDGTGENGRLGDMVACDSAENLAWTYDYYGTDPGWQSATGVMGTKYLETPDDIGMTAFRTGEWEYVPEEDQGRFDLINSTQYDESLPPADQYYIQCTRGIALDAGKTVRIVYAIIAGEDEADFRDNASLAQMLYDNYFTGPEPPPMPSLTAVPSDESVRLYWNSASQTGYDPLSGENDFAGYKLYRSEDRGQTWGEAFYTGNDCLVEDYRPLAKYQVSDPTDPIVQSYIDTGLINGVEYWYCLVAFDTGASEAGVDTLQTGFSSPTANNVVTVTPRTDPAGFMEAAATVEHVYTGVDTPSDGDVIPIVFDRDAITSGDYEVVFEDRLDETYWHAINTTTGDTILSEQTRTEGEPGLYEVAGGMRIVVRNGERAMSDAYQEGFAGTDTTLAIGYLYGEMYATLVADPTAIFSDEHVRASYEFRYTGDSTIAVNALEAWYGPRPTFSIPLEVYNTTTGQRVSLAVYDYDDDGVWQSYDAVAIVDYPYDADNIDQLTANAFPYYYAWFFEFDPTIFAPSEGDVFIIEGAPLNGPDDVFYFSPDIIDSDNASQELSEIRVVPDPYYAYAAGWEVDEGESELQFQNLPEECTIRIYNLSGDLVRELEHRDGSGSESWDLMSDGRQLVASGVYFYHVESPYGNHLGRFAIVK